MDLFVNGNKLCNFESVKTFSDYDTEVDASNPILFGPMYNKELVLSGQFEFTPDPSWPDIIWSRPVQCKKKRNARNRMLEKAKHLRSNFTETFTFTKENDEWVSHDLGYRMTLLLGGNS